MRIGTVQPPADAATELRLLAHIINPFVLLGGSSRSADICRRVRKRGGGRKAKEKNGYRRWPHNRRLPARDLTCGGAHTNSGETRKEDGEDKPTGGKEGGGGCGGGEGGTIEEYRNAEVRGVRRNREKRERSGRSGRRDTEDKGEIVLSKRGFH